VNIQQLPHCFDLNDQRISDDKVSATFTHLASLVAHAKRALARERDCSQPKLDRQSFLIDRLRETRTQMSMHFYRCADDTMS